MVNVNPDLMAYDKKVTNERCALLKELVEGFVARIKGKMVDTHCFLAGPRSAIGRAPDS